MENTDLAYGTEASWLSACEISIMCVQLYEKKSEIDFMPTTVL